MILVLCGVVLLGIVGAGFWMKSEAERKRQVEAARIERIEREQRLKAEREARAREAQLQAEEVRSQIAAQKEAQKQRLQADRETREWEKKVKREARESEQRAKAKAMEQEQQRRREKAEKEERGAAVKAENEQRGRVEKARQEAEREFAKAQARFEAEKLRSAQEAASVGISCNVFARRFAELKKLPLDIAREQVARLGTAYKHCYVSDTTDVCYKCVDSKGEVRSLTVHIWESNPDPELHHMSLSSPGQCSCDRY